MRTFLGKLMAGTALPQAAVWRTCEDASGHLPAVLCITCNWALFTSHCSPGRAATADIWLSTCNAARWRAAMRKAQGGRCVDGQLQPRARKAESTLSAFEVTAGVLAEAIWQHDYRARHCAQHYPSCILQYEVHRVVAWLPGVQAAASKPISRKLEGWLACCYLRSARALDAVCGSCALQQGQSRDQATGLARCMRIMVVPTS